MRTRLWTPRKSLKKVCPELAIACVPSHAQSSSWRDAPVAFWFLQCGLVAA